MMALRLCDSKIDVGMTDICTCKAYSRWPRRKEEQRDVISTPRHVGGHEVRHQQKRERRMRLVRLRRSMIGMDIMIKVSVFAGHETCLANVGDRTGVKERNDAPIGWQTG